MPRYTSQGFTLIELSIVLVIIGLVIAGILVGRDLIRAADMRKVHKQQEEFVTAANVFKMKYNCLPGDCDHATDFFGEDTSPGVLACAGWTNNGVLGSIAKDPGTTGACNGDGDGRFDANSESTFVFEGLEGWRQLSKAGLIGGAYSGAFVTDLVWEAEKNCPRILSTNSCWMWVDGDASLLVYQFLSGTGAGPTTYAGFVSPPTIGHVGTILAMTSLTTPLFTPGEALSYDTKFDDGSPVTGTIVAFVMSGDFCAQPLGDSVVYDLQTNPGVLECSLAHRTGL